ncbi:MAG TPA: hypothetical protein VKD70_12695 [Candidatus Acidoferrum sp.]|nr:hypothetical protein [Candidatus Acidoferrum sp.]
MDETKLQAPASLSDAVGGAHEPDGATAHPAEPIAGRPSELAAADESSCCAGDARVPARQPGVYAPVTVDTKSGAEAQLADFLAFLKGSWRIWATVVGAALTVIVAFLAFQTLAKMTRTAQLKRYDQAVANLTPDHLIARCGQAAEDATKEVFPVILRTIRYKPFIGDPLVFTFSRTAEHQSEWVFLTMTDDTGAKSFDTPEAKIAAFSCLDSKR